MRGALATISGVGARKLAQYGADIIAILQGADPQELLETRSGTGESGRFVTAHEKMLRNPR